MKSKSLSPNMQFLNNDPSIFTVQRSITLQSSFSNVPPVSVLIKIIRYRHKIYCTIFVRFLYQYSFLANYCNDIIQKCIHSFKYLFKIVNPCIYIFRLLNILAFLYIINAIIKQIFYTAF